MGTPPKKSLNLSALKVALVTISFKSDRREATIRRRTPNSTSVFKERSCAEKEGEKGTKKYKWMRERKLEIETKDEQTKT
jgi:hypothetical protein